jgi:multicomponent Na+:H+ antiporter subunit E
MVITATRERTEGGLTAVGLITSLIVDNQLVDLDVAHARSQYHGVDVRAQAAREPERVAAAINAPIERRLRAFRKARA